ncbi:MAG: peptidylprolyl isomerase [Candidatus Moranbacteria bacterium]|nr:peptidylprolyl isomerase [Candidatus Moranbacteria bacterium]
MARFKMEKKIRPRTFAYAFLVMGAAYILSVCVMLYGFGERNFLVDGAVRYLPFPAAVVNRSGFVTVREVDGNLGAVKRFYENQDFSDIGLRVDFTTEDGRKRLKIKEKDILNKLIEDRMIELLADDRDIAITKEMVSQNVQREMEQYGNGPEVEKTIFNLYGWDIDDFKEKIVKPDMYRDELDKSRRATDGNFVQAETKITNAREEIAGGKDFAEVAGKYSEGDSAENGGDLGWFTADQMMPEIAVAAFIMKKGEYSDVIESPIGFHIIRIDDKKTEDGIDKIRIRQVLVRTRSFADWLLEEEKDMDVSLLSKDYYWDSETASVRFKSAQMDEFEKKLEENSAGDISMMFQ